MSPCSSWALDLKFDDIMQRIESAIQAQRRKRWSYPLHLLLRPLGYLEFTDVYSFDLTKPLPPLPVKADYSISRAGAAEIEEIATRLTRDEPPEVIRSLGRQEHHCFVAKLNGEVVAYNWIAFSAVQEEEYRCTPNEDDAICLNAYTAPVHRGKGLHYTLLLSMLHFAARQGKKTAYTAVSLLNKASWKSHVRMGWRHEFTICYFRPNFTIRRLPWLLRPGRYPIQLDWKRHSWQASKN